MKPRDLLTAHRYAEAILAYRERLQAEPEHWPSIAGLADALKANGSYAEALPLLERVDEYERAQLPGSAGRKIDMACLCWCLEDQDRAKQLIRAAVDGILNRSIEFADLAGGVTQGALLYFMGVTTHDDDATQFALSYLEKLRRKSRIKYWPGPIALYLLGQLDTETLLIAACGQSNVEEATRSVENNILLRRQLCVALFYVGIRLRAQGMEVECLKWLQACIALQNPLVEPEWYLAKHEVHQA